MNIENYTSIKKYINEAEEMAQWVESLPHKYKDQNSDPQVAVDTQLLSQHWGNRDRPYLEQAG